jgi:hypothetical protein
MKLLILHEATNFEEVVYVGKYIKSLYYKIDLTKCCNNIGIENVVPK